MGNYAVWIVEDDDKNAGKYACPIGAYIGGCRIINAERIRYADNGDVVIGTRDYPKPLHDELNLKFEFTPQTVEEAKKVLDAEYERQLHDTSGWRRVDETKVKYIPPDQPETIETCESITLEDGTQYYLSTTELQEIREMIKRWKNSKS